jgi:hypothetical protein
VLHSESLNPPIYERDVFQLRRNTQVISLVKDGDMFLEVSEEFA